MIPILTQPTGTKIKKNTGFSVGHDTTEMILNGGFTYHEHNQRALYFVIDIKETYGSSGVFVGKNSK